MATMESLATLDSLACLVEVALLVSEETMACLAYEERMDIQD